MHHAQCEGAAAATRRRAAQWQITGDYLQSGHVQPSLCDQAQGCEVQAHQQGQIEESRGVAGQAQESGGATRPGCGWLHGRHDAADGAVVCVTHANGGGGGHRAGGRAGAAAGAGDDALRLCVPHAGTVDAAAAQCA